MDHQLGAQWIGHRTDRQELGYFRRTFSVPQEGCRLTAKVSADTRYKLYLNGELCSLGPCKGNRNTAYYEEVALSSRLQSGENVLAAEVVHMVSDGDIVPPLSNASPAAVERRGAMGFLFDGILTAPDGTEIENLGTDTRWQWKWEGAVTFGEDCQNPFIGMNEHIRFAARASDWKDADCAAEGWESAGLLSESYLYYQSSGAFGELTAWPLQKRPIPPMYRRGRAFRGVAKQSPDFSAAAAAAGETLRVPAGVRCFFELDAGELTTGYLALRLAGGAGSRVKILYAECYEQPDGDGFKKGVRDDASGVLRGDCDLLEPSGREEAYETFWFRTFRFIRVEIETAGEELCLSGLHYIETGYPLRQDSSYRFEQEGDQALFDVSVRTLQRCMHETYEDCPYYEQLQYVMDSRLEMLFTYQLGADDALARKCIHDFHSSLLPSGLLQSRFPCAVRQIIPGFCLHWIFMLEDHLLYFGDREFLCRYRPTADAVLEWFRRRLTPDGLVDKTGYWPFVDWVDGWDQASIPPANRTGPITVYTLMYACALRSAALVNRLTGRPGMAEEYEQRSLAACAAVRAHCYDEQRGLFRDGPAVAEFSQHAQIWAILAGAADDPAALAERMLSSELPKASYAMAFYLFRALEKAGLYEKTERLLDVWRAMLDKHLTTWVEDPVTQRSECHGWGSLPLYEFPASLLGIRPVEPGFAKARIAPHIQGRKHAGGTMVTVKGPVAVEWTTENGQFTLEGTLPEGMRAEAVLPDGSTHEVRGAFKLACAN